MTLIKTGLTSSKHMAHGSTRAWFPDGTPYDLYVRLAVVRKRSLQMSARYFAAVSKRAESRHDAGGVVRSIAHARVSVAQGRVRVARWGFTYPLPDGPS